MGEQGSCARTSSGYVSSGSRGEGQGSKAGKEKVLEATGRFSGLSVWGMEVDTCLLQLRSHMG